MKKTIFLVMLLFAVTFGYAQTITIDSVKVHANYCTAYGRAAGSAMQASAVCGILYSVNQGAWLEVVGVRNPTTGVITTDFCLGAGQSVRVKTKVVNNGNIVISSGTVTATGSANVGPNESNLLVLNAVSGQDTVSVCSNAFTNVKVLRLKFQATNSDTLARIVIAASAANLSNWRIVNAAGVSQLLYVTTTPTTVTFYVELTGSNQVYDIFADVASTTSNSVVTVSNYVTRDSIETVHTITTCNNATSIVRVVSCGPIPVATLTPNATSVVEGNAVSFTLSTNGAYADTVSTSLGASAQTWPIIKTYPCSGVYHEWVALRRPVSNIVDSVWVTVNVSQSVTWAGNYTPSLYGIANIPLFRNSQPTAPVVVTLIGSQSVTVQPNQFVSVGSGTYQCNVSFTNLQPDTDYTLSVGANCTQWDTLVSTTKCSSLGQPAIYAVVDTVSHTVRIYAQLPPGWGGAVIDFRFDIINDNVFSGSVTDAPILVPAGASQVTLYTGPIVLGNVSTLIQPNGTISPCGQSLYSHSYVLQLPNAVNSVAAADDIIVYPNPTTDFVTVLNGTIIALTNNLGQSFSVNIIGNSCDLSDFQSGIYYLTVEDSSGVKTVKQVVKM